MRNNTIYGTLLIGGCVLALAVASSHPSTIPYGNPEALATLATVNALVHGAAIVGVLLLLIGQVGLCRLLGLQRPWVVAALVATALSSSVVVVAAALDGFVIPKLALEWLTVNDAERATLQQLVGYSFLVASAMGRVYMSLTAVAILLWSWLIHQDHLSRGLPWLGVAVGCVGIVALFGGSVYVTVHELLLMVLCQSAWMIWAGALMLRHDRNPA